MNSICHLTHTSTIALMVNISTGKLSHRSASLVESFRLSPAAHPTAVSRGVSAVAEIRAMWEPSATSPKRRFQGILVLCCCKLNVHGWLRTQDYQVKAWPSLGEAFCGDAFCNSAKL